MTSSNKVYWRFITYFLLFGTIIAVLTSIINYNIKFNNLKKEIKNNSIFAAKSKKEFINHYMDNIEKDIYAIRQNPIFLNYLETPSTNNKTAVYNLFFNTAMSNIHYFQVRFLDKNGQEKIRIDRKNNNNDLIIVQESDLQDKSNRYYFKDTLITPPNSFWYSNLDLNIEKGKIEKPLRPTIRVSTQVFHQGEFFGILIINVEMSQLLNQIKDINNFEVYLVDKKGFFILHPEEKKSWSQYFENYLVQNEFPEYNMQNFLEKDQYHEEYMHLFSLEKQFKNSEGISLILKTKESYIEKLKNNNYTITFYLALLILGISLPTGFLMAIKPARIQDELNNTLKENLRYTDIIDKYVVIITTDIRGYVTTASTAMCDVSGFRRDELIGQKTSIFKSGYMDQKVYKDLWNKITSGLVWQGELQNKTKSGEIFWVQTTILPQFDEDKKLSGFMSISSDITDKKLIEFISERDKLTKLYNRVKLDTVLENEVHRVERYQTALSLIILDIDHFKTVNDTFGHQTGDSVLIELSNILEENVRNTDVLGRWGGEEFLIICPHTDLNGTTKLAEHLCSTIEKHDFKIVGNVTVSLGITAFILGDNIESFLKRADDNLYKAKEKGRNQVVSS